MNINLDERFWLSDSESMALYIHDQVGIIDDYHSEVDWSLIQKIPPAPSRIDPLPKSLRQLLKLFGIKKE